MSMYRLFIKEAINSRSPISHLCCNSCMFDIAMSYCPVTGGIIMGESISKLPQLLEPDKGSLYKLCSYSNIRRNKLLRNETMVVSHVIQDKLGED